MQERDDEAAAGRVDVHGHVESTVGGQLVERLADLGDRFELTGERGAQDRDHADGVLVDVLEHLLGRDDVAALLHRQVARLDVEVAAELLPHHLDVGAHHQVRGALAPVLADLVRASASSSPARRASPPRWSRSWTRRSRWTGRRRAGPRRGTGRRPCTRSAARSRRWPGIRPCRSCSCRTSRPSASRPAGSIHVVTKVARFSRELPSSISSSWMKR